MPSSDSTTESASSLQLQYYSKLFTIIDNSSLYLLTAR